MSSMLMIYFCIYEKRPDDTRKDKISLAAPEVKYSGLQKNVIGASNKNCVGPLDFCGTARIVPAQGKGLAQ